MSKIAFYGKTDVGLKRKNNEDAFIVEPDNYFCLAADGMGGAAAGELASAIFAQTAVELLSNKIERSEEDAAILVQKVFTIANERILEHVKENPAHKGMGCTAELLVFSNSRFIIGHVGDSRTYRLKDGKMDQLTHDHSLVQKQLDEGLITPEEARNHSMRNIILRAVGTKKELPLDILRGSASSGDLFLLCSDGLTDLVDDSEIQNTLQHFDSLPEKTDKLIQLAKDAGGKDNITVVFSEIL